MELDEGEKENHLLPARTSISPQKKESVVITLESKCENLPAAPIQESSDLLLVTTQSEDQNSSGNGSINVEANEMSGIAVMNGKHSTGEEEMDHDMQTEQESEALDVSPSPSSPTSDKMVLCKVLPAEKSQETPKTPTRLCEPEDASGILENDHSEFVPKMDISLSAQNVDKTAVVVGGESPKGDDKTEQKGDVLSGTLNCPLSAVTKIREAVNEEQCIEIETSHLDSGLQVGSQDVSVLKAQEDECLDKDADMENKKPAMSSDSNVTQTASKTTAGRTLANTPMKHKEKDGKDAAESSHAVTFISESPVDSKLKVEDGETESVEVKLETLSKPETSVAESLEDSSASPGSQETESINCKSLKESTHSICRRLSPVCLFPTVTVQGLEVQPSPENHQIAVRISPHKNALWSENNCEEDDIAKKATLKDSPQENQSKSRRRKCRSSTVSPVPSVMTRAATKNKDSKKGRNSTEGDEKQCPQIFREEKPDAVADLAQAEYLGMVHSDMGPPLPRLLTPLTTPPKVGKTIHPRQAIGKLSFPSPMEGTSSPSTPTQTNITPTGQQPSSSSLSSPLHPNGVPSSPLQFGSATPKHAVPVPGRLPLTAMNSPSSSSSPSQENSMRILDTMYPELSAHGRTLSILRGNVSLGICSSASGTSPVASISQVSCFKTVNSTSTAFTKADARGTKRHIGPFPEPKNSKCVKVDDGSNAVTRKQAPSSSSSSDDETASPLTSKFNQLAHGTATTSADGREHSEEMLIDGALQKIEQQCFDLLPVIQSHLYVGNKPKKPVLRSEEIEVISEVCQNSLVSIFG